MKFIFLLILVVSTSLYSAANGLAPVGVMLDHTHPQGEGMISYRLMKMNMRQLTSEGDNFSADEYFNNTSYMMAPHKMEMTMHMLGGMYAFTDDFSLGIMGSYLEKDMTMIRKMDRSEVKTKNSGFSDISINSIYSFLDNEYSRFVIAVGFSLPTGSIDEKSNSMLLSPAMQNGSGSYGLSTFATYSIYLSSFSYGAQLGVKTNLNTNDEDYKVGNQYDYTIWVSYAQSRNLSFSLRLNQKVQDVYTFDHNHTMSSSTDMKYLHGSSTNAAVGINYLNTGYFKGQRLSLEYGQEIDSSYKRYRLASKDNLTIGWSKAF